MTVKNEMHTRLVRGEQARVPRFSYHAIPVPRYPATIESLYQLQELCFDGPLNPRQLCRFACVASHQNRIGKLRKPESLPSLRAEKAVGEYQSLSSELRRLEHNIARC
jgi:hypothetical protein